MKILFSLEKTKKVINGGRGRIKNKGRGSGICSKKHKQEGEGAFIQNLLLFRKIQ